MWWRRVTVMVAVLAVGLGSLAAASAVAAGDGSGIAAENVTSLRKQVGRQVTVVGRIARTGRSDSGMQFLNFADSELTVVCRREDVSRFRQGEPAELYRGKPVEVTGTVELYRGKLQIRLREPSQIRIHSTSGDKKSPATTAQPQPQGIHAAADRERYLAQSGGTALSGPRSRGIIPSRAYLSPRPGRTSARRSPWCI